MLVGRRLDSSIPLQDRAFGQHRISCRFRRGKLFYLEYNLRLLFFLFRQPFDRICAVDLDTLVPAFLVSSIRSKTCIYDAHEYFTEVPEVVDRPFTKAVWEFVARRFIPRLRYAYTVGPRLAGIFEERYGIPFATIRNLPLRQSEHILPPGPQQDKIILYQGRLNTGRGLETAIRAMHQIEGAVLWLAGEGDLSEALRQMVEHEKLGDKVRFLGYLQPAALRELTLLENKGLSYYYSLANKAFDYVQAGLPSIQMDFPEYRALQEKYQVFALLETLEVNALVKVIRHLLEGSGKWEKLHRNCLTAREALCWEHEEIQLAAFYQAMDD